MWDSGQSPLAAGGQAMALLSGLHDPAVSPAGAVMR